MSCIFGLLQTVAGEVERELKPRLGGLTGFLIAGYLPQAWVFQTEESVVTLNVDSRGNATVASGLPPRRDVTISTTHAVLSAALTYRDRSRVPAGPLKVATHTPKGQTAFNFLRGRFGL
jgi:hypothetical protein